MYANQQRYITRTPFCKVCKDAGKSEAEYTSHFVKDRERNVICPTLLSHVCGFCKKSCHSWGHCTVRLEWEAEKQFQESYRHRQEENAIQQALQQQIGGTQSKSDNRDNDGFTQVSKKSKKSKMDRRAQQATPKIANVINAFNALTVDDDIIVAFDNSFPELAPPPSAAINSTQGNWAKVVATEPSELECGKDFKMDDWADC